MKKNKTEQQNALPVGVQDPELPPCRGHVRSGNRVLVDRVDREVHDLDLLRRVFRFHQGLAHGAKDIGAVPAGGAGDDGAVEVEGAVDELDAGGAGSFFFFF
jgi:hypothetical protein